MLRPILRARVVLAMAIAASIGVLGLQLYLVQRGHPFLAPIQLPRPLVYAHLASAIGSLALEVHVGVDAQALGSLTEGGRGHDHLQIGLDAGCWSTPLLNALDPYSVAEAIGSVLKTRFAKPKAPFWEQAFPDLLKFVI